MDRKKTIQRINRQKNRLLKKGASPQDIERYFGADLISKPTSKLTDEQLRKADMTYFNRGKVEVVEGNIYPLGYTERHDITIGNKNYTKRFNDRFSSPLNSMTQQELKKRKNYNSAKAKDRYIKEAKRLGVEQSILNKMESMSINEFTTRIDESAGLLSFDEVFKDTDLSQETLNADDYSNNREALNENFRKFF